MWSFEEKEVIWSDDIHFTLDKKKRKKGSRLPLPLKWMFVRVDLLQYSY
jgi:hypothetical protein